MINNFEEETIQIIDELSLYLEITKYQTMLVNLRNDIITRVSFEEIGEKRMIDANKHLETLLKSTARFGIDSNNKEELTKWMNNCYSYMNNLDITGLFEFICRKTEGINLGLIGTSNYGESSFLKAEEIKVKKQKIS